MRRKRPHDNHVDAVLIAGWLVVLLISGWFVGSIELPELDPLHVYEMR